MSEHPAKKRSLEETIVPSTLSSLSTTTKSKTILCYYQQQELDTLKQDLEYERSMHGLEIRKFQQTIDKLERKVQLLQDDSNEKKELLEIHHEESNKVIAQLKDSNHKALQQIRHLEMELEESIRQQREDEDDREDIEHWKRKCRTLEQQLHQSRQNETTLQEQIRIIKRDFQQSQQQKKLEQETMLKKDAIVSPPSQYDKSAGTTDETVVPLLKKELCTLRITVADLERAKRQHERQYDTLMASYKKSIRDREQYAIQSSRCTKLQDEYDTLFVKHERANATTQLWIEFEKKLYQFLSKNDQKYFNQHSNADDASSSTEIVPPQQLGSPPTINTIIKTIDSYENYATQMEKKYNDCVETCNALQNQLERFQNELSTMRTSKLELQNENRKLQSALKYDSQQTVDRLQHQVALYQRENDSLRSLISSFDTANESNTGSNNDSINSSNTELLRLQQKIQTLQVSWNASNERNRQLEREVAAIQKDLMSISNEKTTVVNELETIKNKYQLLHTALKHEKEKAGAAEDRAIAAEVLAGKGSYNPSTTRILHFSETPLVQALKEEVAILKRQLERHYSNGITNTDSTSTAAATPACSGSTSTSSTPAAPASAILSLQQLDIDKINQRLKENFKEQIALFREGVYLLTGYKIDMITSPSSSSNTMKGSDMDCPTFRVRSVYAENEDDHLLFTLQPPPKKKAKKNTKQIVSLDENVKHQHYKKTNSNDDDDNYTNKDDDDDRGDRNIASASTTGLNLLNTNLARNLSTTPSYQYMTQFNSIPAFLSSVQLSLFEQQTCVMST